MQASEQAFCGESVAVQHPCPEQQGPPVPWPATTFGEWEATAEPSYQVEFGIGGRNQRSVYHMLGQKVYLETRFPCSFFEQSTICMIAAGFTIRRDSETAKLAGKHGGEWHEGYYMDEGLGWPVFSGDDCAERCFAFLTAWLAKQRQNQPTDARSTQKGDI